MVRDYQRMSRTASTSTCSACRKKWCWCDLEKKSQYTCEHFKLVYSYFTDLFDMNDVQHPPPLLCDPSLYCDDCEKLRDCLEIIQARIHS